MSFLHFSNTGVPISGKQLRRREFSINTGAEDAVGESALRFAVAKCGFWGERLRPLLPGVCRKLRDLSVPSFSHLESGGRAGFSLRVSWWGFNKLTHLKRVGQSDTQGGAAAVLFSLLLIFFFFLRVYLSNPYRTCPFWRKQLETFGPNSKFKTKQRNYNKPPSE